MFDFVRNNNKLMMGLLFLLILPSFVFFGIERYSHIDAGAEKVAVVDGKPITQAEWDAEHRQQVERMRAADPKVDLKMLDTPAFKYVTLERIVRDRVLAAAATDAHMVVTNARLANQLRQDPAIATLRKEDGSLDMERYQRALASQGMTPQMYEERVRAELASRQMIDVLAQTAIVSPAQSRQLMDAFFEKRDVQILRLTPADFAKQLNPTDAELETYYKANIASYQTTEQANVEYVVLDLDAIGKGVSVSEQELKTYYDQNAATLGTKEERRASHILIASPKGAPKAEREAAKAKATELLDAVRKAPGNFAEVARKSSQDDSSAPNGGDLGFFVRDKGLDPAVAGAAYKLASKSDISDVVESDFGYHIVQLTDIKPAVVPGFQELRPKLEQQLRTQQAQRLFGEQAEVFTNGVYEQSDSLKGVADKLKLTIHSITNVARVPAAGAKGPLANAKFLGALFTNDSLQKRRNTEAMEIGPNQLVSGRVTQYSPAQARPFAEVKDQVKARWIDERGAELARKDGEAKLAAWRAKPDSVAALPAAIVVSRDAPQNQPTKLIEAVMRADASKLPSFVGVDLGTEGYELVRINKVVAREPADAARSAQEQAQYAQAWGSADQLAYYEYLKKRFKATILAPMPATAGQVK